MKNFNLVALTFILLISFSTSCKKFSFKDSPEGTWQRVAYEYLDIRDMCQSPTGTLYYVGDNSSVAVASCTDAATNQNWKYDFTDANFRSIEYTSDNNLIVTGMEIDGVQDIGPAVLIKLDTLGNQIWRKTFMYGTRTKIYDVIETPDGGFMMCGYTTSSNDAGYTWSYALVVKTDKDGNELWNKIFGDPQDILEYYELYDIKKIDNKYVLVGMYEDYTPYGYLLVIDENGNIITEKVYTDDGIFEGVVATSDTNLVIVGYSSASYNDSWVLKVDISGNIIWESVNEHSQSGYYNDVVEAEDGGFIAVGSITAKFNKNGKIVWEKNNSTFELGMLRVIIPTNDGYYFTTGSSEFVTKFDENGEFEKED
ncbi:MAG: hypothetical protein JXL97_14245 [Bacteroidales bacterium]|nr:hypothetical protein [Bacteroidales bacterium]